MRITKVTVERTKTAGTKLKGIASVVIDNSFAIHGIRIIEDYDRLYIAMPSRNVSPGEYKDVCHPINEKTREMFENAIIEEYNKGEIKHE